VYILNNLELKFLKEKIDLNLASWQKNNQKLLDNANINIKLNFNIFLFKNLEIESINACKFKLVK
jgi:hypothetical protein